MNFKHSPIIKVQYCSPRWLLSVTRCHSVSAIYNIYLYQVTKLLSAFYTAWHIAGWTINIKIFFYNQI